MAVIFRKEVCRQYQFKWRAPNSIMYPVSGYVNSHTVEHMDLQITKHNSLLTLVVLHDGTPSDLNTTESNHQNITMNAVKASKLWSSITLKIRPA